MPIAARVARRIVDKQEGYAMGDHLRLIPGGIGALALLVAMQAQAVADEQFRPVAAITLPGGQKLSSFDTSYVDGGIGLYVLADRTNNAIDVVDTHTQSVSQLGQGAFIGFTGNEDTSGPNGVAIIAGREVWVGDGDSTFKVIDIATKTIIATVATGARTDNRVDKLCSDPGDDLVLMANSAASPPFATLVSATRPIAAASIKSKIIFDGLNNTPVATHGIGQCQWNARTGKFYIVVPEVGGPGDDTGAGGVTVIGRNGEVETTFMVDHTKCAGPLGMAIGPDYQILLGCKEPSRKATASDTLGNGNFSTVIIDERDGHIIKEFNNQSGADEVWYDPGNGHYFLARSATTASGSQILGIIDVDSLTTDLGAYTADKDPSSDPAAPPGTPVASSHSVAADPVTTKTFVPIGYGSSTVCGSVGGNDALGCIAVFKGSGDREDCVAQGAPAPAIRAGEMRFNLGPCDKSAPNR
jgi:hypothetical protein